MTLQCSVIIAQIRIILLHDSVNGGTEARIRYAEERGTKRGSNKIEKKQTHEIKKKAKREHKVFTVRLSRTGVMDDTHGTETKMGMGI